MGNECLACTPNQKYKRYFQDIKVSQMKDLWQTVKIYKIKKIFDNAALPNPQYNNHTYLPYQNFKVIFSEFQNYPQQQVRRLFQFFDFDSSRFIDWNSFFSAITVCYFGSQKTLALIMFMMYDQSLDFKLDRNYLQLLLQNNQQHLKVDEEGEPVNCQQIYKELTNQGQLTIQKWLQVFPGYFQMSKFRNIFNIFQQQKLQKELVKHFNQWNAIFDESRQRFIGYLINLKWFQTWTLYIYHHYNILIDIYNPIHQSYNTIKTCKKTYKSLRNIPKADIDSNQAFHGCRVMQVVQDIKKQFSIKNIDCIHGNLGERPRQIMNAQLQGEYQQILRNGVSQNMDYVIVSQNVWKHLQFVYDGQPGFRRTGHDAIELYPKNIRTYFSLFKGCLDYSSEVRRQVSSYLRVDQLLTESCDISQSQLQSKVVFFKTIKMKKWEQLQDLTFLFTQITSQVVIFLVCLPSSQKEIFKRAHLKPPRDVTEINLGDNIIFINAKNEENIVIFMGKTTQGKYILHFEGQSYVNDICLLESQLLKYCKILAQLNHIQPQKRGRCQLMGLPCGPGLGFINSTFLQILNNKQICNFMKMLDASSNDKLLYCLSSINNMLSKQARVQSSDIKLIIQLFLTKYQQFEVTMCYNFIEDIFSRLTSQLKSDQLPDIINKNYALQLQRKVNCLHCTTVTDYNQQLYAYRIYIPEDEFYYFEVVWVPVQTNSSPLLKFIIKIKKGSTMKSFIDQIQKQIDIKDKFYVLAEVYGNDIIKNFHSVAKTMTLQNLKIRQTDKFFVYQLTPNFNSFVSTHFNSNQSVDQDQLKKDQFIDCRNQERGWIFGKIIQLDYLPYTQSSLVRVMHKFSKNQSWEISYDVSEGEVAKYPLKSHKNCEQYHLRMQQRCFNEASNTMQLINIPLIITLPSWMRWKEFYFFVYLQIRRFISEQYRFIEPDENMQPTLKSSKKISQNLVAERFRQYRSSNKYPYSLSLCDYDGRCIICYKFIKSIIFKGQNENYCEGCKLSKTQPISWQVKPADLMICIDWRGSDRFRKDIIEKSSSYQKKILERKKQQYLLENVFNKINIQYIENDEFLCCNTFCEKKITEKIMKTSDHFVLYIERIVTQIDGFRKVINRPVKIILEGLAVNDKKYDLVGMTSIQGQNLNIRYKSYIRKDKTTWHEYDNHIVKVVDSNYIQRQCALVLYYEVSK